MREIHLATAVYVFNPAFTHLLFLRHKKPPIAGFWLPPGGHVDAGETPNQAALREVLEETGQQVTLLDLAPFPSSVRSDRTRALPGPLLIQQEDLGDHDHLDCVYVAVADTPTPLQAEDGQPVAWLSEAMLDDYPVLPDCLVHARHLFAHTAHYQGVYARQRGKDT